MSIFLIDIDNLDREWVKQSDRVDRFSKKIAAKKLDYADLKNELEVLEADISNRVRSNPKKFGITKVNETAIKNAVTMHETIIKHKRRMNRVKYRIDILQGSLNALEHKKKGLEDLVVLHGRDYFSRPYIPFDDRDKSEKRGKKSVRSRGRMEE